VCSPFSKKTSTVVGVTALVLTAALWIDDYEARSLFWTVGYTELAG